LPRSIIPEPELDKLRRKILEIEVLRPGLEASGLRQHLSSNGSAATVDADFAFGRLRLLDPTLGHT
jgi:hypothetical protein